MAKNRKRYTKQNNVQTQQVNNSASQQQTPLSDTQLYDMLEFARQYYNFAKDKYGYDGTYTPYLTNERLSEIGMSPINLTKDSIANGLNAPIANQNALVGYSEFLKLTDPIAKRASNYLGNLPAFDYTFTCTNVKDRSEYNSKEYLSDLNVVKNFLSKFDVRGQFSYINRRMFDIDAYYSVFRMDGDNYEFQELPYQYCKITGKNTSWGFQFDFDMSWFLRMGLSFDQYPPIFKKMYDNVMSQKFGNKYDPSNPLQKRKGTFALWSQTSSLPQYGNFACFKMNADIFASVPFLTSLFQDAANRPLIRSLSMDQNIIAAQKVMIGLIPLLKEQKSGQVKDALAVSPTVMGQFLSLLKQGLSNAIKITGAPFSDVKQVEFEPPTKNMYGESNSIEAGNSGVTADMVYSQGNQSATAVRLSNQVDQIIATAVYPQFEKWLSSQVNSMTRKYKFKFKFEGTTLDDNREMRRKIAMEYANMGIFDEQKLAAAWGMDVFELTNHLEMGIASDFMSLLRLPPNSHTASLGSASAGRPMTSTPSDSTDRNLDRVIENSEKGKGI